jgi:hypothetical protein
MPNSRLYFGGSSSGDITATNVGTGTGIFLSKVGSDLQFKTLVAGSNVSFSVDGETITVNASDAIGVEGAINLGTGEGIFASRIGSDLQFRSLVAGSNISLSADADSIIVSATGVGEINTASNIGTGEGFFAQKTGVDLEFKSLLSEDGFIVVSSDASNVYLGIPVIYDLSENISFLQSDVNILNNTVISIQANVLALQELQSDYLLLDGSRDMTGDLNLNGFFAYNLSDPVDPQDAATKSYVDSMAGEITTASNIGSGEGVFAQKINTDLQFKTLVAGANITLTPSADSIIIESLGGGGGNPFDYIQFNLLPTSIPSDVGVLYWDEADGNKTLSLTMDGGSVTQHIGQVFYIRVKATAPITKGQVVMITGTVGTSGAYEAQPAFEITDGHTILGVATEDIASNDFGYITEMGLVRGISADGSIYGEVWSDGDELFWNPNNLYPGGLTNVKPLAPDVKASIGSVVKASNGMAGSIYVRINPGSELGGTDSNVEFDTLTDGDLILYSGDGGYWTNVTFEDFKNSLTIPSSVSVKDEGTTITSGATSLNFTGSGVTATSDVSGNVTVNISGGGGGGGSYADIPIGPSLNIDWTLGTTYNLQISSDTSFSFSNPVPGKTIYVIVENITGLAVNAIFPETVAQDGLDQVVFANSYSVYTFVYSAGVILATAVYNMV